MVRAVADGIRFFLKWAALTAGILLFGTIAIVAFRWPESRPRPDDLMPALLVFAVFYVSAGIVGGLVALACRSMFRRTGFAPREIR